MMDFYVEELRACAQAIGLRFDAFLYGALLEAKWETERLFGLPGGGLVTLSKRDRARLADRYQAVCDSGLKAQLSDFYPPRPAPVAGEPLAWAFRDGPPTDSN
jgi:hypothetical protein